MKRRIIYMLISFVTSVQAQSIFESKVEKPLEPDMSLVFPKPPSYGM
jgi:hypothetical protein